MNKYPYIPREYYPAVMFACKMVRESGYKNKAIRTAARYYGSDAEGMDTLSRIEVVKGISKNTVENRFAESDLDFDRSNDYGGSYAPYRFHTVIGEYETKEEAEKAAKAHKGESR